MSNEIWKDIDGFPGYQVSNKGKVRNIKNGNVLKSCFDKSNGYMVVNLYDINTSSIRKKFIHRLVAQSFIPNPENKRTVNHIDCDKTNNDISNLEWATDSENMKHAFSNGLCKNTIESAKIQQQKLSKLPRTSKQIESARENIIKINKRPKTERQLETSRNNINSEKCRNKAKESHYNRHPLIRVIETGKIYRSQRDLAKELGVNESAICACLHGRKTQTSGYHFEYVIEEEVNNMKETKRKPFLYDYQMNAVNRMFNGCILNGGVGSGKSRTGLYYYFKEHGGKIDENGYVPMKNPKDLYIITTAKKREDLEWEQELTPFLIPNETYYPHLKVVIDSWNNIGRYTDAKNSFFLFDEQRVISNGAWSKAFIKISKSNNWVLLTATPADTWLDYIPVFVANGFYKNRSEFIREHVVYKSYTKYPVIDRYLNTGKLVKLRNRILVDMDFTRKTIPHHEDVYTQYDVSKYKDISRKRWNPWENKPIENASEYCFCLRRVVNEDESRQIALLDIVADHPRVIVFYSFDYELDILRKLSYVYDGEAVEIAEYNGHKHEPIPESNKWVYLVQYTAGCEGFNCIKTDTIVFYSQNYSYKVMRQATGRIDRLNTPYRDLYYYHLRSRSGIDLAIKKALDNKKKFSETGFDKNSHKKSGTIDKLYEVYEGEELKIAERISQLRQMILIHSCIYYKLNDNIISDEKFDEFSRELVRLQNSYPDIAANVRYADEFKNWTGVTGFDLPIDDEWVVSKAQRLLTIRDQKERLYI